MYVLVVTSITCYNLAEILLYEGNNAKFKLSVLPAASAEAASDTALCFMHDDTVFPKRHAVQCPDTISCTPHMYTVAKSLTERFQKLQSRPEYDHVVWADTTLDFT